MTSEFTNYLDNIHVIRYKKDREEEQKQGKNHISKMKGYCKDKFRFDQAPILYKPTIRDIVFGGTYDRVFSKTVTYKINQLRCSDGIILPRSFLDLMGTKQRA